LRSNFQLEHGIDELHRNGVVDGRLNRNLSALLDRRFLVVLRGDLGFRKELADAFGFRGGDEEVDRKVRRAVAKEQSARRGTGCKVGVQRQAGGSHGGKKWRRSTCDTAGTDRRISTHN